jgi:hypothetical protein
MPGIKYGFLFFFIFSNCSTPVDKSDKHKNMLQLNVIPQQDSAYLNQPLDLEITLTNIGDSAVIINKRMEIGYKNSISRELYADVEDLDNPQNMAYSPVKINRNDPQANDYDILQRGESLSRTIDFFHYYHPKKPGKYKITMYYQADETLKNRPVNVWKGIVVARPVTIEILQGKIQPVK